MSEISDDLPNWALRCFEQRLNTAEMAKLRPNIVRWPASKEAACLRALHLGLERRRVQRVADAIGANV